MDKRERDKVAARLISGGLTTEAAEQAADILAKPDPGKVSAQTQAMIDKANARVQRGTGWKASVSA
jgi:hypothetical protein